MALQTINIADKETLDQINTKLNGFDNKLNNVEFLDDGIIKGDNCVRLDKSIMLTEKEKKDGSYSFKCLLNYKDDVYAFIGIGGSSTARIQMYKYVNDEFELYGYMPYTDIKFAAVHNDEIHVLYSDQHWIFDGKTWHLESKSNDSSYAANKGGLVSYNGKLHLMTKSDNNNGENHSYYYTWNKSNGWTKIVDNAYYFPHFQSSSSTFNYPFIIGNCNGYIYYICTYYNASTSDYYGRIYRFNGSSSTLILEEPRLGFIAINEGAATVSNNMLYFYTNFSNYSMFKYDPLSSSLTMTSSIKASDDSKSSMVPYGDYIIKITKNNPSSILKYSVLDGTISQYYIRNSVYSSNTYGPYMTECSDGAIILESGSYNSNINLYKWTKDNKFYKMNTYLSSGGTDYPFNFTTSEFIFTGGYLYYINNKNILLITDSATKLIYTSSNPIIRSTVTYMNGELYFADSTEYKLYKLSYDGESATVVAVSNLPSGSNLLFSLDNKIYNILTYTCFDGEKWYPVHFKNIPNTTDYLIEVNGFLHNIPKPSSSSSIIKTHYVYDKYFNKYQLDDLSIMSESRIACKFGDKILLIDRSGLPYLIDTEVVYAKKANLEAGTIITFQEDKKHLIKPLTNCIKLDDGNLQVVETGFVRFGSLYTSDIGTINIQQN